MGLKSHETPVAHEVVKGDPKIDGPYLDDYNAAYDAARRESGLPGQDIQEENYDPDSVPEAEVYEADPDLVEETPESESENDFDSDNEE